MDETTIYRTGNTSDDYTLARFSSTRWIVFVRSDATWDLELTQHVVYDRLDDNAFHTGTGPGFVPGTIFMGASSIAQPTLAYRHSGASFFEVDIISPFGTSPDQTIHSDRIATPIAGSTVLSNVMFGEYFIRVRTDPGNEWSLTIE